MSQAPPATRLPLSLWAKALAAAGSAAQARDFIGFWRAMRRQQRAFRECQRCLAAAGTASLDPDERTRLADGRETCVRLVQQVQAWQQEIRTQAQCRGRARRIAQRYTPALQRRQTAACISLSSEPVPEGT